jgi:hypothetical protein
MFSLSPHRTKSTPYCISLSPCASCPPGCRAPCMQSLLGYWFCWCTLGVGRLVYVSLRLCAQLANYVRHAQRPQHICTYLSEWERGELKLAASSTLLARDIITFVFGVAIIIIRVKMYRNSLSTVCLEMCHVRRGLRRHKLRAQFSKGEKYIWSHSISGHDFWGWFGYRIKR